MTSSAAAAWGGAATFVWTSKLNNCERDAEANGTAAGVDTTIRCKISRDKRENSRNNGCTQTALSWRLLRGGEKLVSDFYRKILWEKRPHESSGRWRTNKVSSEHVCDFTVHANSQQCLYVCKGGHGCVFSEICAFVICKMPAFCPSSELRRLTNDIYSPDYQRKTRIHQKVAVKAIIFWLIIAGRM